MKKHFLLPLMILLAMAVGATGYAKKSTVDNATEITDHLAKNLDLTDVQQRKLEIICNDILDKRAEIFSRQMMNRTRVELTSQLHRDRFDRAGYEDFRIRSLRSYNEFYMYLGQKLDEFHSLLSPPQRERLVAEIEKNRSRWFTDK